MIGVRDGVVPMVKQTVADHVVSETIDAGVESGTFQKGSRLAGRGWGLVGLTDASKLTQTPLFDGAIVGGNGEVSLSTSDPCGVRAQFSLRADGAYVQDVGSCPGVWVEGVRARCMPLAHGNLVRVGSALGMFVEAELSSYGGEIFRFGDVVCGARQRRWVETALCSARSRTSFVIEGDRGVGKTSLARAILRTVFPTEDALMIDARVSRSGHDVVRALASHPSLLLVLHLEHLDGRTQAQLVRSTRRAVGTMVVGTLECGDQQALCDGALASSVASPFGGARVRIPILDERREDIAAIAFVLAGRQGVPGGALTIPVLEQLVRGGWRGGVRQLDEVVRAALLETREEADRVAWIRKRAARPALRSPLPVQEADDELARGRLLCALNRADGTVARAARTLQMSRQAFYREIRRLRLRS